MRPGRAFVDPRLGLDSIECGPFMADGRWPCACCVPVAADPDSACGATVRLLQPRIVRSASGRRMRLLRCLTARSRCRTPLWRATSLRRCRMLRATFLRRCPMSRATSRPQRRIPLVMALLRCRIPRVTLHPRCRMPRVTPLLRCPMARVTCLLRLPTPRMKRSRLRQTARSALSAVELLATWWSMASSRIRRSADA